MLAVDPESFIFPLPASFAAQGEMACGGKGCHCASRTARSGAGPACMDKEHAYRWYIDVGKLQKRPVQRKSKTSQGGKGSLPSCLPRH